MKFSKDCLFSDAELKIFREQCIPFHVFRGNLPLGTIHAFYCSSNYNDSIQSIRLSNEPVVIIKAGDTLIQDISKEKLIVESVKPLDPSYTDCIIKYKTNNSVESSTVFNINEVSGNSVIGNQNTVTINQSCTIEEISKLLESLNIDKSESEELIQTLENIENTKSTVSVRGVLGKFSNLINKHHELLIAIGGWAVQLMIGK